MSESDAGVSHKIVLGAGRQAYLVCIEGGLTIGAPDGEVTLDQRDAVELVAPKKGAGALHVHLRVFCSFIDFNPHLVCFLLFSRHNYRPSLVRLGIAVLRRPPSGLGRARCRRALYADGDDVDAQDGRMVMQAKNIEP